MRTGDRSIALPLEAWRNMWVTAVLIVGGLDVLSLSGGRTKEDSRCGLPMSCREIWLGLAQRVVESPPSSVLVPVRHTQREIGDATWLRRQGNDPQGTAVRHWLLWGNGRTQARTRPR